MNHRSGDFVRKIRSLVKGRALYVCILLAAVFWHFFGVGKPEVNVLLISIDTCRADRLSCYGYHRESTPHIDRLAKEGILFRHAFSPMPLTLPAHCSLFTGTYPPYHGVHNNLNYALKGSHTTLAEILRKKRYDTGGIVSSFVLDSKYGVGQGFEEYNDHFDGSEGEISHTQRQGEQTTKLACQYLEAHQDKGFFLFVHYTMRIRNTIHRSHFQANMPTICMPVKLLMWIIILGK